MLCGDEVQAVVVDLGSSFSKFGTAGEDLPRHIFKSEIAHRNENFENVKQKFVVGESALKCHSPNSIAFQPINNGIFLFLFVLFS